MPNRIAPSGHSKRNAIATEAAVAWLSRLFSRTPVYLSLLPGLAEEPPRTVWIRKSARK